MFRGPNVTRIYDTNISLAIKVYNIVVLVMWRGQKAPAFLSFFSVEHGEDYKKY